MLPRSVSVPNETGSHREAVIQIYAAVQAINGADFFLIARTDARGTSAKRGLDEAITRVNLYMVCSFFPASPLLFQSTGRWS